jgi:hypothetical protein
MLCEGVGEGDAADDVFVDLCPEGLGAGGLGFALEECECAGEGDAAGEEAGEFAGESFDMLLRDTALTGFNGGCGGGFFAALLLDGDRVKALADDGGDGLGARLGGDGSGGGTSVGRKRCIAAAVADASRGVPF